jgi:hypothetical protein
VKRTQRKDGMEIDYKGAMTGWDDGKIVRFILDLWYRNYFGLLLFSTSTIRLLYRTGSRGSY